VARKAKKKTPLLILGKTGTLGKAFVKICEQRFVPYVALSREELNICDPSSVLRAIDHYKPWAMINATGFVRVDDAETNREECFRVNSEAPKIMGEICAHRSLPFMTFSSDLVFDGSKRSPYLEEDQAKSLNVYGTSKARGETLVQQVNPGALVIRTSGFFGPWDKSNFVYQVLESIKRGQAFEVANDIITSPTYVPDLVNTALDLFIDEASGIWHITNDGMISWAEFARQVAQRGGYKMDNVHSRASCDMKWKARRPVFSALQSEKGLKLPSIEHALERYFMHQPIKQ
jgi:dTDP-4-dehydrorhamnose reductase